MGSFAVRTCPKINSRFARTIFLWGASLSAQSQRQTLAWRGLFVARSFAVSTCPKTNCHLARTICCWTFAVSTCPETNSRLTRTICCEGLHCRHLLKDNLSLARTVYCGGSSLSSHAQRQTLAWRGSFVVGTFSVRTCPKTNSRLARIIYCGGLFRIVPAKMEVPTAKEV